jgi:hypothetical protein
MANFDGLVVSLRSSRALARRTYPFLTERGRELGARRRRLRVVQSERPVSPPEPFAYRAKEQRLRGVTWLLPIVQGGRLDLEL